MTISLKDDEIYVFIVSNNKKSCQRLVYSIGTFDKISTPKSLQSLSAEICLRNILSVFGTLSPEKWKFRKNRYGKPRISNYDNLYFNISHSRHYIVLAISKIKKIGIDIQYKDKKINVEKYSRGFCSKNEYNYLAMLNKSNRFNSFFRIFSLKEAYIKAKGGSILQVIKKDICDLHNYFFLSFDEINNYSLSVVASAANIDFLNLKFISLPIEIFIIKT